MQIFVITEKTTNHQNKTEIRIYYSGFNVNFQYQGSSLNYFDL